MHIGKRRTIFFTIIFICVVLLALFATSYKTAIYGSIALALIVWIVLELNQYFIKNKDKISEGVDNMITTAKVNIRPEEGVVSIWNKKLLGIFAILSCIFSFIVILAYFFEGSLLTDNFLGLLLEIFVYIIIRLIPILLMCIVAYAFYRAFMNFLYVRKNEVIVNGQQLKYSYSLITLTLCIIFPIVYSYLFLKFAAEPDYGYAGPYIIEALLAISFIYILYASGLIFIANKIDKKETSSSFIIPATILAIVVTLEFCILLLLPFVL